MPSKRSGARDGRAERSERQRRRGNQEPATWQQADAGTLLRAVRAWSEAGGMLGFGKTRDGGALTLCIWEGGEMSREYFRPSDDVTAFLEALIEEAQNPVPAHSAGDPPRINQEPRSGPEKPFRTREQWEAETRAKHPAKTSEEIQLSFLDEP